MRLANQFTLFPVCTKKKRTHVAYAMTTIVHVGVENEHSQLKEREREEMNTTNNGDDRSRPTHGTFSILQCGD
jgi:hypothetical protein